MRQLRKIILTMSSAPWWQWSRPSSQQHCSLQSWCNQDY